MELASCRFGGHRTEPAFGAGRTVCPPMLGPLPGTRVFPACSATNLRNASTAWRQRWKCGWRRIAVPRRSSACAGARVGRTAEGPRLGWRGPDRHRRPQAGPAFQAAIASCRRLLHQTSAGPRVHRGGVRNLGGCPGVRGVIGPRMIWCGQGQVIMLWKAGGCQMVKQQPAGGRRGP